MSEWMKEKNEKMYGYTRHNLLAARKDGKEKEGRTRKQSENT